MSTGTILIVIVAVVALLAILAALYQRNRRAALQQRFGPEYERAVHQQGGRLRAEKELLDRQRMRDDLNIRPLSEESRRHYGQEWSRIQQLFVDDPSRALASADHLVLNLLAERGYPTDDVRKQEAALSVEHASVMDRYRRAHEISAQNAGGEATTEELRQATVDYRSLVEQLLAAGDEAHRQK